MAFMTGTEYIESLRKLNTRVYMFGEKSTTGSIIRSSVRPSTAWQSPMTWPTIHSMRT